MSQPTTNKDGCSCCPNPPPSTTLAAEESDGDEESTTTSTTTTAPAKPLTFQLELHVRFFKKHLLSIPQGYESLDTSRMTLLYFCLSALDVLGAIESVSVARIRVEVTKCDGFERRPHPMLIVVTDPLYLFCSSVITPGLAPKIIEWIYAQQVHPFTDPKTGEVRMDNCGFRGGTMLGVPFEPNRTTGFSPSTYPSDSAHIAMTYTALCSLRILGDTNFSRVNRAAVIGALKSLQQPDGAFASTVQRSESSDMRFLFCACAISAMLQDWSGFDVERSIEFIRQSQSYDGGIGLWPGCEGHGGSTYCAVASLCLMNRFNRLSSPSSLLKWCLNSQGAGYHGRPNKPSDTCYSFWIGGTLNLLAKELGLPQLESEWLAKDANRQFNLSCQAKDLMGHYVSEDERPFIGGLSKEPRRYPDLLHAYFGICGLSLIGRDQQLLELDCLLGLTQRVRQPYTRQ